MSSSAAVKRVKLKPAMYESPIALPAARRGRWEVKHTWIEAGESVPVIGSRNAIMRGINPAYVKLSAPLLVHELLEDGARWMSDLPEELFQIASLVDALQPHGRVLVGGLGLGILTAWLLRREQVKFVTTVEIERAVSELCFQPQRRSNLLLANIHEYLAENQSTYEFYLLDTWSPTSESVWFEEV